MTWSHYVLVAILIVTAMIFEHTRTTRVERKRSLAKAAEATLLERERVRGLLIKMSADEKFFAAEKCLKDSQAQRMHESVSAEFRIFVRKHFP